LFVENDRVFMGARARALAAAAKDEEREELLSFKTILSAQNPAVAHAARLRPTIDPTQSFTYRDALVLYLAFLFELSSASVSADTRAADMIATAPRRFTHPAYRPDGVDFAYHRTLFDEAQALATALGPNLSSVDGMPVSAARLALDGARARPGIGRLQGEMYEAHATALAHLPHAQMALERFLVFDMGAGTTDIAGFNSAQLDGALVLQEVLPARCTLAIACDELDSILLDVLMRKWGLKTRTSEIRMWRSMKRSVLRLKEELFTTGKTSLNHEGKKITVRLNDLRSDRQFKHFEAALADAYRQSLTAVGSGLRRGEKAKVGIILAGGGSRLDFLQELASAKVGRVEPAVFPLVPGWAMQARLHDDHVASFPQLATSLGCALAPVESLAS
jgi:hypothetical protein